MLRAIYSSASGMIMQAKRLDVIAENVANVDTPAFKRAEPVTRGFYQVFEREIARFPSERGSTEVPGGGSLIDATSTDFSPGSFEMSGNPLDLAIDGPGFFVVRTPSGERYTRAGNFSLNSRGELVTQNGEEVMGEKGPIIVPPDQKVEISPDGDVMANGVAEERILVVDFPKPYTLTKYGRNLYAAGEKEAAARSSVTDVHLQVGALEGSNVNPIKELVAMIETERSYDSGQRTIQALDESLNAAVNRIAGT